MDQLGKEKEANKCTTINIHTHTHPEIERSKADYSYPGETPRRFALG